eukprot:7763725-Pyramimonas_sp.AAC.1
MAAPARVPAPFRHTHHTLRCSIWNATEGPNGCARMRPHSLSAHPLRAAWPHNEIHRLRCRHRRYAQLHTVRPFDRIV